MPEKRLEVKRSTFVYYNEIYKPHIEKAEIGKKLLSEINDEDINLWKLEIEGKRTPQKKPLSTRLRDECLNEHVFLTLAEARRTIAAWRHDYNHSRPHSSLGALTPVEFAMLKGQQQQPPQEGEKPDRLYL